MHESDKRGWQARGCLLYCRHPALQQGSHDTQPVGGHDLCAPTQGCVVLDAVV